MARIFLSYAREDEARVRDVYRYLVDAEFQVWMDQIDLLPGQRWQQEIPRALRESAFILIFFSRHSALRRGSVQREFRLALDTLKEMPPDAIETIPIRLDDCEIPAPFRRLPWCDLSEQGDFDCIIQALRLGIEQRRQLTSESVSAALAIPMQAPPAAIVPKVNLEILEPFTNSIGMAFVPIPAGAFTMGSPHADLASANNEHPTHRVEISQPFYLGKYAVTQAQWEVVMGNHPSHFKGDPNRPVERVSWDEVQRFIENLNAKEGKTTYRLPTEAEWEYACRAGTTTVYSFGDNPMLLSEYAWYSDNAKGMTHPVGQLQPNDWGLYDTHGNVWEWVQDWYSRDYYQQSLTRDPKGPDQGRGRVVRGGSWFNTGRSVRTAQRVAYAPDYSNFIGSIGFRLALALSYVSA